MSKEALLASLAEKTLAKKAIITELQRIHEIEKKIKARIVAGFLEVTDQKTGEKLTQPYIDAQIERLADELMADTTIKNPVLISLMDGALPFMGKLQAALTRRHYDYQYSSMQVSSYQGTKSSELTITSPSKILLGARDVVVVDDVCDTGQTAAALHRYLTNKGAASIHLMVLVDKVQLREGVGANPDFTGVTVSKDAFIAGMGMDYEGLLRSEEGIYVVDPSTLIDDDESTAFEYKKRLNEDLEGCIIAINALEQQLYALEEEESTAAVSPGHSRDALFGHRLSTTAMPQPPVPQTPPAAPSFQ